MKDKSPGKDAAREERLAEALRANLRKRKAQARARSQKAAREKAEDGKGKERR